MNALFVTGATGLIGRHLLRSPELTRFDRICCLSRRAQPAADSPGANLEFIQGDLTEPESYARELAQCSTVLHLAALTGNAVPAAYFAANVRGTACLVQASEQAGIRRFILVSTIAVKYGDTAHYPYAESKRQAEDTLAHSRLQYAIVRPTIVAATGGKPWETLVRLGRLPIPVLLGSGRVMVQPIHVQDVAAALARLAEQPELVGTFDLGGPDRLSFDNLIQRIHLRAFGRTAPMLHLPVRPLAALLAAGGKLFPGRLPLNAGQLSAFVNDSTIQDNPLFRQNVSRMKNLDQMLAEVMI